MPMPPKPATGESLPSSSREGQLEDEAVVPAAAQPATLADAAAPAATKAQTIYDTIAEKKYIDAKKLLNKLESVSAGASCVVALLSQTLDKMTDPPTADPQSVKGLHNTARGQALALVKEIEKQQNKAADEASATKAAMIKVGCMALAPGTQLKTLLRGKQLVGKYVRLRGFEDHRDGELVRVGKYFMRDGVQFFGVQRCEADGSAKGKPVTVKVENTERVEEDAV